jgi:hypothetical protein
MNKDEKGGTMREEIAILKATVRELDEKREVLVQAIAVLSGKVEPKARKVKRQGRPKGSKNKEKDAEVPEAKPPKSAKTPKAEKPADEADLPTLPMKRGKGSPFDSPAT